MNKKLEKFVKNASGRYIYPFFWPDENSIEHIAEEVEAVYKSGCGGLCLEARPFEKFCRDEWWETADAVLSEAKKRGMKVWILDDKHFPTGFANGMIKEKYPQLRRHFVFEHHLDVHGPKKNVSFRLPVFEEDEKIICACAYKRTGSGEDITGKPLPVKLMPGALFGEIDVPEGLWRIFVIVDSANTEGRGKAWHIDMLSKESAAVLIEAVYEEHYSHLSQYFGNTLEGFFSDEPCFSAQHSEIFGTDPGGYFRTVGQPGMSLPWNITVEEELKNSGFADPLPLLPMLWYSGSDSPQLRRAYMDAVTRLWNRNFSCAVGDWCRAHGVIYTGHIIEDLNAHTRLGCSAGHYFRGLSGQDISGIDIVLHQVMPGMSDHITSASVAGGIADGGFYHYTLAQLGSSLARITPRMKDRAMCELFGAYGWAEGTPMMKWIADFLMLRGINRFVPHAFSVKHPFDDCPPHFYARGENPQFEGFSSLMGYINTVSSVLDGAVKKTDGAILYYAENEWMSGNDFMLCDAPAKSLFDSHIDYDILPLDALKEAEVKNGRLFVNGKEHRFLVIPESGIYPPELYGLVERFEAEGLAVFTAHEKLSGGFGRAVPAAELGKAVIEAGLSSGFGIEPSKLRIAEFGRENEKLFYLFNEEPAKTADLTVTLPASGAYSELHILNDSFYDGSTADGKVRIRLEPGESVILVFGSEGAGFGKKQEYNDERELCTEWEISTRQTGLENEFRFYKKAEKLFNVSAFNELPAFSGEIKYSGTFVSNGKKTVLNLGEVGFTAKIKVNSVEYPVRISAPYEWDISDAVKEGENRIEMIAANTLCNRIYDDLSTFVALPASGVLGPVKLKTAR